MFQNFISNCSTFSNLIVESEILTNKKALKPIQYHCVQLNKWFTHSRNINMGDDQDNLTDGFHKESERSTVFAKDERLFGNIEALKAVVPKKHKLERCS